MFHQIFKMPFTIKRQFNAPLLEDRLRYLAYRAKQETLPSVLRQIARYQLIAIKYLNLKDNKQVFTLKELSAAAKRLDHHVRQQQRFKNGSYSKIRNNFIGNAKRWLQFLGRMEIPKQPSIPSQVAEFICHMRKEQDVSDRTICDRQYHLVRFFNQIKEEPGPFLAGLTPARLDAILIHQFPKGVYGRETIRTRGSTLRIFFHYAERQGWCRPGIANCIQAPRIYKHATLPSGPCWEDVQRLLKTTEGDRSSDIRDRAIILLLAVYGLRGNEARKLCLEDFDWGRKILRIKHSKFGPIQQFPLVQTVEQALTRYLKEVRPQRSIHREIFLTLYAPYRPLTHLFGIVSSRWEPLDVAIKHHGPHSLRHACATRLINQGLSLKAIADQLGHRDMDTTRIYAKVDMPRLREVANFDLGGVL